MCKKLLALVALLGMVSVACAVQIDDFESYFGPDIEDVWMQDMPVAGISLQVGDASQGNQAGDIEWNVRAAGQFPAIRQTLIP
jgi:hypothetical protein